MDRFSPPARPCPFAEKIAMLILTHNVSEAAYLARIPAPPQLMPLNPFQTALVGQRVNTTQQWARLADFVYISDRFGKIVVPATVMPLAPGASVTDLASIPDLAQGVALRNDSPQILCGSIPHDYGFEKAGEFRPDLILTFDRVNQLLCEAMWYCNATDFQIDYVATAVYSASARMMWNRNCDRLGHPERRVALV